MLRTDSPFSKDWDPRPRGPISLGTLAIWLDLSQPASASTGTQMLGRCSTYLRRQVVCEPVHSALDRLAPARALEGNRRLCSQFSLLACHLKMRDRSANLRLRITFGHRGEPFARARATRDRTRFGGTGESALLPRGRRTEGERFGANVEERARRDDEMPKRPCAEAQSRFGELSTLRLRGGDTRRRLCRAAWST